MYYTTPVYQFRFKCHLCPNKITIKTDPGNMDYVITEGARRVEQRWDPSQNGQIVPDDKSIGRILFKLSFPMPVFLLNANPFNLLFYQHTVLLYLCSWSGFYSD